MFKIRRIGNKDTVFRVSGRMHAENLAELKNLIDAEGPNSAPALDLKDLILVDRDAVRFLKGCESTGIELRNCSGYIREWITRERDANEI